LTRTLFRDSGMGTAPRSAICSCPSDACICRRSRSSPRPRVRGWRATIVAPALEVGLRGASRPKMSADLLIEAFLVIADRHLVDRGRRPAPGSRASDLQIGRTGRSCAGPSREISRSQRHSRMSGLDADRTCSSLNRVLGSAWVLRLAGQTRYTAPGVQMDEQRARSARPSSLPSWADRFRGNGSPLDNRPTVPPISQSTKSAIADIAVHELLDRVGDVGNHLDGGAQIFAAAAPWRSPPNRCGRSSHLSVFARPRTPGEGAS